MTERMAAKIMLKKIKYEDTVRLIKETLNDYDSNKIPIGTAENIIRTALFFCDKDITEIEKRYKDVTE